MSKFIKKNIKDPGSAITHFIGLIVAIFSCVPLLIKAGTRQDNIYMISAGIYAASLILLYFASTIYHTFNKGVKINKRLKKFDHMMISVLIAGTYTPICLLLLRQPLGTILLILIWALALGGMILKAFWVTCPKWLSSVLYIGMGWSCLIAFPQLLCLLSLPAFLLLLGGGILYTVGGVIYALKLSVFNHHHKYFGSHEIFHLFVMGGSLCHFILIYVYLL